MNKYYELADRRRKTAIYKYQNGVIDGKQFLNELHEIEELLKKAANENE